LSAIARIALVSAELEPSGLAAYLEGLVRGHLSSHAAVAVVAAGGVLSKRLEEAGATVMLFPQLLRRFVGPLAAARAAASLYEFGAQIVHVVGTAAYPAARRLARALRLPLVVTVHEYIGRPEDLPWQPAETPLVIAVSETLRENLVNDGGVPKSRLRVAPVGIDASLYPARPPERPPSAAEGPTARKAARTSAIGCVGPLDERSGTDTFLRAASRVLGAGKDAEFVVVGTGRLERELRSLARELGVRGRVTFLGGGVRPEQILPNLDVFVMPAPREALISGILQAMACARPVVATAAGGVFAAVRDGETGFLVPPHDDAAMAEKLVTLVSDDRLRAEMGRAGRELVEREFGLEPMIRATEAVYAAAAAESRAGP